MTIHGTGESEIVSSNSLGESELAFEGALRPQHLRDFVGQIQVRKQIELLLEAAKLQNRSPDHILLAGPPGLGKTTLAMIVAGEAGYPLKISSGPAIQHAGDLAALLSGLVPGEILFIDEVHRMARSAEEMLYLAMEDFRIDIMIGKGAGATSVPLELPPFTMIGATTRAGMLPSPLRDRFGFTAHLDFYEAAELNQLLIRSAGLLGMKLSEAAAIELSKRSRGTPRIANRLLRRVRDYCLVTGEELTEQTVHSALELYDVDRYGLDRLDRAVLESLAYRFRQKAVGLSTLASAIGEDQDTIETVIEPFLIREGLMMRTPRGRMITESGLEHIADVMQKNKKT